MYSEGNRALKIMLAKHFRKCAFAIDLCNMKAHSRRLIVSRAYTSAGIRQNVLANLELFKGAHAGTSAGAATGATAGAGAGTGAGAGADAGAKSKWSDIGKIIFKAARTVTLGFALYQTGYTCGIGDYAKDPSKVQHDIIMTVVQSSGGNQIFNADSAEFKRIGHLVARIVSATKAHVDLKLLHLFEMREMLDIRREHLSNFERSKAANPSDDKGKKAKDKNAPQTEHDQEHLYHELAVKYASSDRKLKNAGIPQLRVPERIEYPTPSFKAWHEKSKSQLIALMSSDNAQQNEALSLALTSEQVQTQRDELNKEIKFWLETRKNIKGDWKLNVTNSSVPNAFVHESLPRMIFVCEGFLKELNPTDDELGMVLSHEISHYVLQHGKQRTDLHAIFLAIRIGIASVIGFEWFLFVDFISEQLGNLMENSFSRDSECEADILGQQIAARSCFDTTAGANIFKKLHEFESKAKGTFKRVYWNSTHPPTDERYEKLAELSKVVNKEKLNHDCHHTMAMAKRRW